MTQKIHVDFSTRPFIARLIPFSVAIFALLLTACGGSKAEKPTPYLWNTLVVDSDTVPNQFLSTYSDGGDLISIHKQSHPNDYWLQRHDTQGNLLWQQTFLADPTSALLYGHDDSGAERINVVSSLLDTDITWRAFDGNGQLLFTRVIPAAQRPGDGPVRVIALEQERLVLVTTGARGLQAAPIQVFEWTPADFVLRYQSEVPVSAVYPLQGIDGSLLIGGRNTLGSNSRQHPDVVIKLDHQLQEAWVAAFQNSDAYVPANGTPYHLLKSGELLIEEITMEGEHRLRVVTTDNGASTLRYLPDDLFALSFVGAREDGGYYLAHKRRDGSGEQGSLLNSTRIVGYSPDGEALTHFDLPTDATYFPDVAYDPAVGFRSYRLTSWQLAVYNDNNTKEAMQGIIELYDTDGALTKTIKGKQAHWGARNGSPTLNHQIGERFGQIRVDEAGQVFTTVTSLSPLGGDNHLVQFRAYP